MAPGEALDEVGKTARANRCGKRDRSGSSRQQFLQRRGVSQRIEIWVVAQLILVGPANACCGVERLERQLDVTAQRVRRPDLVVRVGLRAARQVEPDEAISSLQHVDGLRQHPIGSATVLAMKGDAGATQLRLYPMRADADAMIMSLGELVRTLVIRLCALEVAQTFRNTAASEHPPCAHGLGVHMVGRGILAEGFVQQGYGGRQLTGFCMDRRALHDGTAEDDARSSALQVH